MHVNEDTYTSEHICRGQRAALAVSHRLPAYLRQVLVTVACSKLASSDPQGILLTHSPHSPSPLLTVEVLGCQYHSWFRVCSGDLNSGSYVIH